MTVLERLQENAAKSPHKRAFVWLQDADSESSSITYADLLIRARAIGTLLQQHGHAGDRVLLVYPPGLPFVTALLGCWCAGMVPVPTYPPTPLQLPRTLPRFRSVVADSLPSIALTSAHLLPVMKNLCLIAQELERLHWLSADMAGPDLADSIRQVDVHADHLALIQYTSGSTSTPKGVMLTHRNIAHNQALIATAFEHDSNLVGCGWLPPYHDMGLMGKLLQPIWVGGSCALMPPLAFLQRPLVWLRTISRYRATTSGGPNFAYDLCVRKVKPAEMAELDLSSWKVAFNGAEPVLANTMEQFATTFAACGFKRSAFNPCYGLAEATLIVSGSSVCAPPITMHVHGPSLEQHLVVPCSESDVDARMVVSSGRAVGDTRIVVVDPASSELLRAQRIGEIAVQSESVAIGYWNNPEATRETFAFRLAGSEKGTFLRTGDLGFLWDGELFITGRSKDLLIVHGRNIYPQDIERTVEKAHAAIRPGFVCAFAVEECAEPRLVVVAETRQVRRPSVSDPPTDRSQRRVSRQDPFPATEVRQAAVAAVAREHGVSLAEIVFVPVGELPKTTSGKLQRNATKIDYLQGKLRTV